MFDGATATDPTPDDPGKAGGFTITRGPVTVCGGCPSECAFRALIMPGGVVEALVPVEGHPCRTERLCDRGQRRLRMPLSGRGRIEHPLRRRADGGFEEIPWDVAYAEIAERLLAVRLAHGPASLACTTGLASSAKFYADRLMAALGSPNVYGASGACDVSRLTGWRHTLGYSPESDVANTDYIVYLGRSPLESASATEGDLVRAALDRGCTLVAVDPRRNPTVEQASEWLRIRPGRDLALLLGIAHVLVFEDLYDHDFVARHTTGIEEFACAMEPYTAAWAAAECDVAEEDVLRVARGLAAARPRSVVDCGFHGGLGVAYVNCAQTARMIALVNALLGNYGQPGGCLAPRADVCLGELDPARFPAPDPVDLPVVGSDRYPYVNPDDGLCTTLGESIELGEIHALVAYASNPVMGYGNAADWQRMLGKLDLLVCVDVRMSETARIADYVLPDVTFLESDRGVGSCGSQLIYRNRVLDQGLPDARPAECIVRELAQACGVGEYFTFTADELVQAQVEPYGVDLGELRAQGFADAGVPPVPRTGEPVILTPSGTIDFASGTWERAGLGRVPFWQPPLVGPDPDDTSAFRLINGNSTFSAHTSATLLSTQVDDAARLGMASVWLNDERAAELGIADGDLVEVYSDLGSDRAIARVTCSIHPEALFTTAAPGGRSGKHAGKRSAGGDASAALGVGPLDHTPLRWDPLTGAALTQENVVHVRKI